MDLPVSKEGIAPVKDRLITTLFLAALFHGIVILGVSFGVAGSADPDALPTLEVLLVDTRLPEANSNDRADYLAQRNSQGSGNTLEAARTSSPLSSPLQLDNPGVPQGQALDTQDLGGERSGSNLLATSATATRIVRIADAAETNSGPTQTALLMQTGPASPLPSSDDGKQLVLKGQRQEELLVTPNTRESDIAVYLDAWKRKVERVGTVHFPLDARRQGLSGSPVLEVAILPNGTLEDIVVRRSSGHAELDQAALAILKLATPFDPFPAALRSRHKMLRFAYEWQFLGGALVNSAVQAPVAP